MDHRQHAQEIYTALIQAWMTTHASNPGPGDLTNWAKVALSAAKEFDEVARGKK